ncbi:cytochrome c [Ancylobacter dichloromethanicus]|uniref:Cytochrome c n=1 Tax=Ancylobacter dichloromethanicus TaxID=518825 RepID=A0A9W6J5J0_9HYPH|nr:cytochrome c [Ancylobacter dichloromethanicus]MBS7554034.1 cytochrome c [Ancylobacter dichloromethanicus]GLK71147.1 cytochrome c [Ancylobacter dichloromethanicus]
MVRRLTAALAAGILTVVAATAVMAQADVVKERQTLLKQFGDLTKPVGGMLRGSTPFDLATVQAALDAYVKNAKVLPTLFPEGSDSDPDTEALPAIWTNKADFDARFAKLGTDAAAARAAITDEASFKANFPAVVRNCGGCHDNYRQKN